MKIIRLLCMSVLFSTTAYAALGGLSVTFVGNACNDKCLVKVFEAMSKAHALDIPVEYAQFEVPTCGKYICTVKMLLPDKSIPRPWTVWRSVVRTGVTILELKYLIGGQYRSNPSEQTLTFPANPTIQSPELTIHLDALDYLITKLDDYFYIVFTKKSTNKDTKDRDAVYSIQKLNEEPREEDFMRKAPKKPNKKSRSAMNGF